MSTTDPDATLMLTKNGADLGYHTHYVVDGGKARIILNVLVTPSEVMDHRTEFFSADQFRYETERDLYMCPAGKELHFDRAHSTERSRGSRARARECNHCALKAKCTTSKQGRSLCRSVDKACLDRVRAYQPTEAYKKALRKRQVWVEPLFAEAKDWHGMRRFRGTHGSGESTVKPS